MIEQRARLVNDGLLGAYLDAANGVHATRELLREDERGFDEFEEVGFDDLGGEQDGEENGEPPKWVS